MWSRRGEHAFVLLNDFPYNSVHLMVAPYRHVGDLAGLAAAERAEIMELLVALRAGSAARDGAAGLQHRLQPRPPAGAGVADHVHGHVVPRWNGDTNFMPVLGGTRVVPESLDETTRILRDAWEEERQQHETPRSAVGRHDMPRPVLRVASPSPRPGAPG